MNYNKIILAGNLTRDPELSYTPSQTPVCKFGIAVNKKFGDKEKTCFVECTAFKSVAENIQKFFAKGRNIFIEGELEFESWTAKDGQKRSRHSVMVWQWQFVGSAEQTEPQRSDQPEQDDDIPF